MGNYCGGGGGRGWEITLVGVILRSKVVVERDGKYRWSKDFLSSQTVLKYKYRKT